MSLERLKDLADRLEHQHAGLVECTGHVTEISAAAFRIDGLTPFLRLGDRIEIVDNAAGMGEIVRIDADGAVVKPFANRVEVGLGARARIASRVTLAPDDSWRGRIVDALGLPIDGAGPLTQG